MQALLNRCKGNVELQRHGIKSQLIAEKNLIDLAYEYDIPLVATNDCFFQNQNKFESHQVLTCIDKGHTISSDNRRILTKEHYLKHPEKMITLFQFTVFAIWMVI